MKIDIVKIQMKKIDELIIKENKKKISKPCDVKDVVNKYLDETDREEFIVICLDTKNKINNITTVAIGDLTSAIIHPREVFKTAILSNAKSIIIAHNHPSGNTYPSKEDIKTTQKLKKAGQILGIEILDHVIVSANYENEYYSFKEERILGF